MSLYDALVFHYPDIAIGPTAQEGECVLSEGAIVYWGRAEPKPDESALLASYNPLPIVKARKAERIRSEARTRIESKYPEWRQRSAALGVYPSEYVAQMQADIAAVIAASNTAEDAVAAATTVAEVEAVTATWPVI